VWRVEPGQQKAGVTLWQEEAGQNLGVELDGQTFHHPDGLSESQRTRLAGLAAQLLAWLELTPAGTPALHLPGARPEKSRPPPRQTGSSATGADEQPSAPPTGTAQPAAQPQTKTADLSIAAQIDAILQSRLEGTPLARRGIRLVELPGREVALMVGLEKYTDLEAIPDPEVQAAIRAAVAEWEKMHAG
jgi:hypothetical protein